MNRLALIGTFRSPIGASTQDPLVPCLSICSAVLEIRLGAFRPCHLNPPLVRHPYQQVTVNYEFEHLPLHCGHMSTHPIIKAHTQLHR
jgi:hypothetical protein